MKWLDEKFDVSKFKRIEHKYIHNMAKTGNISMRLIAQPMTSVLIYARKQDDLGRELAR